MMQEDLPVQALQDLGDEPSAPPAGRRVTGISQLGFHMHTLMIYKFGFNQSYSR